MGRHFYTIDPTEASTAIRDDYILEGVACYVYDPSSNQPDTTPLIRLFFTAAD